MEINKNSNLYTVLYASVVVVIVAFLLASFSLMLKAPSEANERIDKMKQVLASLNLRNLDKAAVEDTYAKVVVRDMVVDAAGAVVAEKGGFDIEQKAFSDDCLPIYICRIGKAEKIVLPLVGKGLWGPIWGYLALNDDCRTVYGAYFNHASETAGLGALIKEESFQNEFKTKVITDTAGQVVLTVVKKGNVKAEYKAFECDGISGATLTTNGVSDMLHEYIAKYKPFLDNYLKKKEENSHE